MRFAQRSLAVGLASVGVLAFWSASARAEPDDFGLGTGIAGASDVVAAKTVVNVYAPLTAATATGATSVTVGTAVPAGGTFSAGQLVLIYQATGTDAAATSGAAGPFDLDGGSIGHFEFARLSSVSGGTLNLTAPLVTSFPATGAQVIYVPEYTTVTVATGASLAATAWNGQTGGVIAFLSEGAVTLTGNIDADSSGFRGGLLVNTKGNADIFGCTELDPDAGRSTDPAAWGQKGEGLTGDYGPTIAARGNLANGAGGGDCDNSGGGGGGNIGVGGQGGNSWSGDGDRPVGGLPGAALSYAAELYLSFGGGGGAGQENNSVGSAGGIGGGVVFFRGASLAGSGTISARGQSVTTGGGNDGQGGGGAGGTVSIRLTGSAVCTAVDVSGGKGGSLTYSQVHGPGGGGGAGAIFLQTTDASGCSLVANAGQNGEVTLSDGGMVSNSGQPGGTGTSVVATGGFTPPTPPTITQPIDGEYTTSTPTITGTAPAGSTVDIYIDGVFVGAATADASGNFTLTVTSPLAAGSHTVTAEDVVDGVSSGDGNTVTFAVGIPTAPTITSPTTGSTVGTTPTITGTAVPGSTVTIYDNGVAIGTTTADTSGNYSFTPTTPLTLGSNVLTAQDESDGQSSLMSAPVVVTAVPGAPTLTSPTAGESVSENPTLTGTADPGSTVTVYANGIEIGQAVANASGAWTLTPTTSLAPGSVALTATETESGETSSASSPVTVSVVPPAPVVTSPTESETVGTLPQITGTAPANATVQVIIDGVDVGQATADGSGVWTFTPTTPLSGGSHTVAATDTVNGETSPSSATISFTVGASSTTSGAGGTTGGTTTTASGSASATTSGGIASATTATTSGGVATTGGIATTSGGIASATTATTSGGVATTGGIATTSGGVASATTATTSGGVATTGGIATTSGGVASATTATTSGGVASATTATTSGGVASATTATTSGSASATTSGGVASATTATTSGSASATTTGGIASATTATTGGAATTNGGEEADAGLSTLGGGGCSSTPGEANPGALALIGLAVASLRRRRRR